LVSPPSLDCDPVSDTDAPKMMGAPVLGAGVPLPELPHAASNTASPTRKEPSLAPRMRLIYRFSDIPSVTSLTERVGLQDCLTWPNSSFTFDRKAHLPGEETIERPIDQILAA